MNSEKLLSWYLGHLRFLYLAYQNFHWQCSGLSFYQDHLLFQRLYEEVQENVDSTAEKIIGVFNTNLVNLDTQMEIISSQASKYNVKPGAPILLFKTAIAAEEEFQKLSMSLYNALESEEKLTLGLDDLIAAQSNDSEERLYLLKSSLPQT